MDQLSHKERKSLRRELKKLRDELFSLRSEISSLVYKNLPTPEELETRKEELKLKIANLEKILGE